VRSWQSDSCAAAVRDGQQGSAWTPTSPWVLPSDHRKRKPLPALALTADQASRRSRTIDYAESSRPAPGPRAGTWRSPTEWPS
jgi:hypothetical protein